MTQVPSDQASARPAALGANYRKLFGSAVSANLGDGVMSVALVWLASSLTREAFLIALIAAASRLPWLLFSLPAGVIADRYDRRKIVAAMDLGRFVIVGVLALVLLPHARTLPNPEELAAGAPEPAAAPMLLAVVGLVALLLGFAEVLRDNTAQALMPAVVHRSQLERANGRLWGAEVTMNSFVGPPLGGVLIAVTLAAPFGLNAVLLASSALLVFWMRGSFAPSGGHDRGRRIQWRREIGEGFRWLWNHRLLRALALMLGLANLLTSLAFVNLVLFAQDVLGLYEGWQFGLVVTGTAAGAVLGSLIGDRVAARLTPGVALVVSTLVCGTSLAVMGLVPVVAVFWLAGALGGVFMVVWNIITVSLRQRLIPDALLGRVNSVYRFFGWGTMSVGTLLGGVLVSLGQGLVGRDWALRGVFLLAGIAYLAMAPYVARRAGTATIREAEAAAPTSPDAG